MEIEIAVAVLILFALVFLATIDMAFIQLSDVSLRRLSTETEEKPPSKSTLFKPHISNLSRYCFSSYRFEIKKCAGGAKEAE